MNRTRIILTLIGCLGTIAPMQAQERPVLPALRADSVVRLKFMPPPATLRVDWLREEVDPILQQRRKLNAKMAERSQKSVIARQTPQTDANDNTGLLKVTLGNTSADNWSPYQDRALDARTIRFPLPKDMHPNKQPGPTPRLDKTKR